MKSTRLSLLAFGVLALSTSANAITAINATNLSGLAASDVSTLIQTIGIVADHHAYMPAGALGMMIGVDVGLDVTYIPMPSAFATVLATASSQSTSQLPSGLLLPKVNVHKGLPLGIDLGGSFMTASNAGQTVYTSWGLEGKWTFINNIALPAVAVRASYSSNTVYFINASSFTVDATASKSLVLFEPYIGAGMQFWSGSLSVPTGIPQLTVSSSASGSNPHFYGGIMFKLLFAKLVAQADYSTAGFTTFGGKVSLGF
jgi:hypothetical protein